MAPMTEEQIKQTMQWLQEGAQQEDLCHVLQECAKCEVVKVEAATFCVASDGPSEQSEEDDGSLTSADERPEDGGTTASRDSKPAGIVQTANLSSLIDGIKTANDVSQHAMSLTNLLQPSTATPDHCYNAASALPGAHSASASKKRKLAHATQQLLAICRNCGCPYNPEGDRGQLCIFHNGHLERDEAAWADVDDFGSISDRDYQLMDPESYYWTCCEKSGTQLGCTQRSHDADCRQSDYAELKLRRADDLFGSEKVA